MCGLFTLSFIFISLQFFSIHMKFCRVCRRHILIVTRQKREKNIDLDFQIKTLENIHTFSSVFLEHLSVCFNADISLQQLVMSPAVAGFTEH
jgi:hypothetical protein